MMKSVIIEIGRTWHVFTNCLFCFIENWSQQMKTVFLACYLLVVATKHRPIICILPLLTRHRW